jgi:cation:H+ antiporter
VVITILLFIIGIIILIKGADLLVDGATSVAKRIGISTIVVGLTIVSFGTSAPELVINIFASIKGKSDIAIGNVLGSNIANILLVLSISAVIYPIVFKSNTKWKEIPFSLLAIIVFAFMVNDSFFNGESFSGLTRNDGLVLLSFFVIFLYYSFSISKVGIENTNEIPSRLYSLPRSILLMIIGLAGLTIGGRWIVNGAVSIATTFGISEAFIASTIVAVGTSLPELATSAVASYKRNVDIAVGNVIGSNIFNIFFVLGISSIINPLPFSQSLRINVWVVIIATLLLFLFMFIDKRHILKRWEGVVFIMLYIGYIISLIMID